MPALSGCGDNIPPDLPVDSATARVIGTTALTVTGEQAGSGSSAQQASIEAWAAGYSRYQPQAVIAYDPQGSGAGVTSFLQGAVGWAGTDVPLTASQRSRSKSVCSGAQAVDLPVFVSPVALVYNIDGLNGSHIRLSAALAADIFAGRIVWWDDARIAAANPALKNRLPHLRITPVWRSDQSGTSQIVSTYLAAAAPGRWPKDAGKTWPSTAGQGAKGTAGVATVVSQAQGTIGYVEAAQAGSLGTAALLQGSTPVLPGRKGASAFVTKAAWKVTGTDSGATAQKNAGRSGGKTRGKSEGKTASRSSSAIRDLTLSPDYADTSSDVYPLTQISYLVACPAYPDAGRQRFVGSWLYYIASQAAQELSAQVAGSAPLPEALSRQIQTDGRALLAAAGVSTAAGKEVKGSTGKSATTAENAVGKTAGPTTGQSTVMQSAVMTRKEG